MDRARRRDGALTKRIIEQRLWGDSPLFLIDVGCSGGIDRLWRIFEQRLRVVAFDPLVAEIDRLTESNTDPGIVYEAAFVGCPDADRLPPPAFRHDRIASKNNDPFPRVSAAAAQSRSDVPYIRQQFNAGAPVVLSDRTVVLDEYVRASEHPLVDFIKVDTDGHDIEVLLGAEAIMAAGGVLGFKVEVQFHGAIHPNANTFANIDRLLRQHGFTMFGLTTYQYSRQELPAPFVFDLAAQTTSGQVLSGDALYFRDMAAPDFEEMWPCAITPERVLKLACLFDIFGLPDCAAELLLNRGDFLAPALRSELLDQLVDGVPGSYAALMATFAADFSQFYPSRLRQTAQGSGGPARAEKDERTAQQIRQLRDRMASLGKKNAELRERLRMRGERIDRLAKRLEQKQGKE